MGFVLFSLQQYPSPTVNPVKLVAKVLCYARKHKCPENRSALTYWEDKAPSRLDLDKGKYGGPFTEEEVEDVKTFLRLLPLIIVSTLATAFNEQYIEMMNPELYGCYDSLEAILSFNATYLFIILLHQFLLYPCFCNYIPSMLKRIGLGLVLPVVTNITFTVLAGIGNYPFILLVTCFTVSRNLTVNLLVNNNGQFSMISFGQLYGILLMWY